MSKRINPPAVVVADLQQVEGALAEMARIERKLGEVKSKLNEEVDAAKARAALESVALAARHKELAGAIKVYSVMHKSTVFPADRKSLDLAYGVVGFQASTEIVQQDNVSPEFTISKLHDFKYEDGITVKESVNKSAMSGWTDQKLESVGLRRVKKDTFYIEVKAEKLPTA